MSVGHPGSQSLSKGKGSPAVAAAFADAAGDTLIGGRDVARTRETARKASTLSAHAVHAAALEPATFRARRDRDRVRH